LKICLGIEACGVACRWCWPVWCWRMEKAHGRQLPGALELFACHAKPRRWFWLGRTVSDNPQVRAHSGRLCDGHACPVRCAFAAAFPEQAFFGLLRTPDRGACWRIRKKKTAGALAGPGRGKKKGPRGGGEGYSRSLQRSCSAGSCGAAAKPADVQAHPWLDRMGCDAYYDPMYAYQRWGQEQASVGIHAVTGKRY